MYKRLKQMPIASILYDSLKTNPRNYNNILKKSINLVKNQSSFEKYRNNIKKTWSTIKEIIDKTSQRKQLPESFNIDVLTVTDKHVIANKFNDFFTSIGLKLAKKTLPTTTI